MTTVEEGETWFDPATEMEFTIQESTGEFGMSVAEEDRLEVPIKFETGQTSRVPHERFRGRTTYEFVSGADE